MLWLSVLRDLMVNKQYVMWENQSIKTNLQILLNNSEIVVVEFGFCHNMLNITHGENQSEQSIRSIHSSPCSNIKGYSFKCWTSCVAFQAHVDIVLSCHSRIFVKELQKRGHASRSKCRLLTLAQPAAKLKTKRLLDWPCKHSNYTLNEVER